jgi:hypothetical protein
MTELLSVVIGLVLLVLHYALLIGIFVRLGRIGSGAAYSPRTCPHCMETISARATACPHCTRDVAPPPGIKRAASR